MSLVVTGWTARRAGAGITIEGKSLDGFPVKMTNAEIRSASPHPIANGVVNRQAVSATLRP